MDDKKTEYKTIAGWEALAQEFDRLAEEAKASTNTSKFKFYAAKPTLHPHYFDYTNGSYHALLSTRVDEGEPRVWYCDLTERELPAANNVKKMVHKFVESCQQKPVTVEELPNYFKDFNAVNKEMVNWTAMPVADRPGHPKGEKNLTSNERMALARKFVEAASIEPEKAAGQVKVPKIR